MNMRYGGFQSHGGYPRFIQSWMTILVLKAIMVWGSTILRTPLYMIKLDRTDVTSTGWYITNHSADTILIQWDMGYTCMHTYIHTNMWDAIVWGYTGYTGERTWYIYIYIYAWYMIGMLWYGMIWCVFYIDTGVCIHIYICWIFDRAIFWNL